MLGPLALLLALLDSVSVDPRTPAPWIPRELRAVVVVGRELVGGRGAASREPARFGDRPTRDLADVVDASLPESAPAVVDRERRASFAAPVEVLEREVALVEEAPPTLVIALDLVAHAVHGPWNEAERVRRAERVLLALGRLRCTLLVGDVPDWTATSPAALPPEVRPSTATLERVNTLVADFARARENVVLVPLRDFYARLARRAPFELGGVRFGEDARGVLLQKDALHTTNEGACAVWIVALDAWRAKAADERRDRSLLRTFGALEARVRAGRGPRWLPSGP